MTLASSVLAHADPLLTVDEFRRFAGAVAPRVNLFKDVWEKNPDAELFGGTSRDFLYWWKGELVDAVVRGIFGVGQPPCELRACRNFDLASKSLDYLSKYPDVFIGILTGYQDIRRVPQGPQPTFVRALRYGFFQLFQKRRSAVHRTALKECFETKSI